MKLIRRIPSIRIAACAVAFVFITGCNQMDDTTANFAKAIDKYYSTNQSCVWTESAKFPVQEDTADTKETSRYDSLVYQGLLVRSSDQKVVNVTTEQVTNYDLSDKGRAAWVPDPQQPGAGNFCYGHRKVISIDSFTPTSSKNGATTDVVYRYSIAGTVPDWATAAPTLAAFPGLRADLSGNQVGRATLTDTRKGWQVINAPWAHISDSDIYK
jgi:hypothetical protein